MYCQECGKQNADNAKYCYNCGKKLPQLQAYGNETKQGDSVETSGGYDANLRQEYITAIWNGVLEAYFCGREIEAKVFYEKAPFYSMSSSDVDKKVAELQSLILKVNNLINHLFRGIFKFGLTDDEWNEVYSYCVRLGFAKEDVGHFIDKYVLDHKIVEKRKTVQKLVDEYADNGTISGTSLALRKYSGLKEDVIESLAIETKKRIEELEKELEAEYSQSKDFQLSEAAMKKIEKSGRDKGLSSDEIKKIIPRFEAKSGIIEKRKQLEEERVKASQIKKQKKLNSFLDGKYPMMDYVLWDKTFSIDGRYYLENYLEKQFADISETTKESYEKINKGSEDVFADIFGVIMEFDISITGQLSKMKAMFDLHDCEQIEQKVSECIETWKTQIFYAMGVVKDSKQQKEMEAEYRNLRKDMRGRWQGGGFGLGGAIKGAITAGAMNMATGMAHSAVNAVGNAGSQMNYEKKRKKALSVFDNIPAKADEIASTVCKDTLQAIRQQCPDCIWHRRDKEEQDAKDQLLSENVEVRETAAIRLLTLNPYHIDTYRAILTAFPNPEIYETLNEIAKKFNFDLQKTLAASLEYDAGNAVVIMKTYREISVLKKIVYLTDAGRRSLDQSIYKTLLEKVNLNNATEYCEVIYSIRDEEYNSEADKRKYSTDFYHAIFKEIKAGEYKNYEKELYSFRDYISQHKNDVDVFDQEFIVAFTSDMAVISLQEFMQAMDCLVLYGQRYPDSDVSGKYFEYTVRLKNTISNLQKSDASKNSNSDLYQRMLALKIIYSQKLGKAVQEDSLLFAYDFCDKACRDYLISVRNANDTQGREAVVEIVKAYKEFSSEKEMKSRFQKDVECAVGNIEKYIAHKQGLSDREIEGWFQKIFVLRLFYSSEDQKIEDRINKILGRILALKVNSIDYNSKDAVKRMKEELYAIGNCYALGEGVLEKAILLFYSKQLSIAQNEESIQKIRNDIIESADILPNINNYCCILDKSKSEELRIVYDYLSDYVSGQEGRSNIIFKPTEYMEKEPEDTNESILTVQRQVDQVLLEYNKCNLKNAETVSHAIALIETINEKTGCGKSIILELKERFERLEIEMRTVMGVTYATREQADIERKKYVGNVKYETAEEAEQMRDSIKQKKEVEEKELKQIAEIEQAKLSYYPTYKAISALNVTCINAKKKEKEYKEKAMQEYKELKEANLEKRIFELRKKKYIYIIIFALAFLPVLNLFLNTKLYGKIIIVFITLWVLNNIISAKDDVALISKDIQKMKEMDKTFEMRDGEVYLKS